MPGSPARTILAFCAGGALLLLTAIFGAWFFFFHAPSHALHGAKEDALDLAHGLAAEIRRTFQLTPRVTVRSQTVVEETRPVLELATAERTLVTRKEWTHVWAGSTKRIRVEGDFVGKAGFKLQEPWSLELRPEENLVRLQLPPAQLLSTDMRDLRILEDTSGWWNRVGNADREAAIRELRAQAEEELRAAGTLHAAEKQLGEQLRASVQRVSPGMKVEITFRPAPAAATSPAP